MSFFLSWNETKQTNHTDTHTLKDYPSADFDGLVLRI